MRKLLRNKRLTTGLTLVMAAFSILPPNTNAGLPWQNKSNTEKLADCIDKLEKHIDQYGSVVPKQPDVWGQARLTKYRRMVEVQLEQQKDGFKETINATISRSDQASFANSMALQAAISGPQAFVTRRGGSTVVNNAAPASAAASSTTTTPDSPIPIPAAASSSLLAADSATFGATKANSQTPLPFKNPTVALEPTVMLDQMTTYLNHLNQLRRTNEGDDTADAPGYGLHLVRIPVSVLPGKKTQQGYGAEITVTAEPVITDSLLPTIYRSLITNDVIDLTSAVLYELRLHGDTTSDAAIDETMLVPPAPLRTTQREVDLHKSTVVQVGLTFQQRFKRGVESLDAPSPSTPGSNNNPGRSAADIFSDDMFDGLMNLVRRDDNFPDDQRNRTDLILDLRKIAQAKINVAYAMLAAESNRGLWNHASQELRDAILNCNQNDEKISNSVPGIRKAFVADLKSCSGGSLQDDDPIVAMAWAIIFKATVLNQQLLEDMESISQTSGSACHPGGQWLDFYVPNPSPQARSLFAQYVRARWPIHVFAIDPMTADQNVADSYSRRRDMQLALSLAFTSGQIGAQNFTRYARRLELDMETIALNRTQVGFSHGNDTFGWRFFPRVQSPPTEGNATVLFRDLLIGGPCRNRELDTMKLEPGARECVALVIMPTFVPSVRFDTRTNWFKLSNPKHKEFDLKTTVQLGTDTNCLRELSAYCQGDTSVRGTDLALLMRSVDQLERRLPLQTCVSQVPFDLTHSGHALFNNGVSDLAPRLRGYYGEPGAKDKDISIVLLGSNFSISETQVVAGNILLTANQVQMLSREVLVITIPAAALKSDNQIDVHVATPYGVSNHLDVQLPKPAKPSPKDDWVLDAQSVTCTYNYSETKDVNGNTVGKFEVISYTPAVVLQFNGDAASDKATIKFNFDDLGPFTTEVAKRDDDSYRINVKGLGQKLLNTLQDNARIDSSAQPDGVTFALSPVSVSVVGSKPAKLNGGLKMTFKRSAESKPQK